MPQTPGNRGFRTFVARAWRRRCPRCGTGALFRSRFRLARSCGECGLVYRREQGALTGQMYLGAAVSQVFTALWIVAVFLVTDWTPLVSILVSLPVVVAFCYWFLPRSMALWVAVEFMTDLANRETWATGAEPAARDREPRE